jgi:thioredoxin 2
MSPVTPQIRIMAESLHLVCPQCEALNRIPSARLDDAPRCGRCHQSLLPDHPLELTSTNFQRHIERNDLPVVVDFWAPWCGPCRSMAPQFAEAAEALRSTARLSKVNTDAEPGISNNFGIRSIPTLIVFKAGREIARQAGAMGKADIVRWVRDHS